MDLLHRLFTAEPLLALFSTIALRLSSWENKDR